MVAGTTMIVLNNPGGDSSYGVLLCAASIVANVFRQTVPPLLILPPLLLSPASLPHPGRQIASRGRVCH